MPGSAHEEMSMPSVICRWSLLEGYVVRSTERMWPDLAMEFPEGCIHVCVTHALPQSHRLVDVALIRFRLLCPTIICLARLPGVGRYRPMRCARSRRRMRQALPSIEVSRTRCISPSTAVTFVPPNQAESMLLGHLGWLLCDPG